MNKPEVVITNSSKKKFPTDKFLFIEKQGLGHSFEAANIAPSLSVAPLGLLGFAAMGMDMKQVFGVSYMYPRQLDGKADDMVCVPDNEGLKVKTIEAAVRDAFSQPEGKHIFELELGGSVVAPEAQGNGVYKTLFESRLQAIAQLAKQGSIMSSGGQPVANDEVFVTLCSKGAHQGNKTLKKMKREGAIGYGELELQGIQKGHIGKAREESLATSHMAEKLGMKLIAVSSNNLGPIYAIPLTDLLEKLSTKEGSWGLPKPTILIDSQSSPALKGIEVEQRYYRLYLMGKSQDVVVVDYPVDQEYLEYHKNVLHLPVPNFLQIQNVGGQTLSENILMQDAVVKKMKDLVEAGYMVQFFNLNGDELNLAQTLSNPTYIVNLEATTHLGTKDGFREFCMKNGIPMPKGFICDSEEAVKQAIAEIKSDVIIKSSKGTGGKELGSNAVLTVADFEGNPSAISEAIASLTPQEPPYVVEAKLDLPEASLHIFIDDEGEVVIKPVTFGQLAHEQSYNGGYYPNDFPKDMNDKIIGLANSAIVPALKRMGATGFHCMDFLYDKSKGEIYFIEDNTRPGALDFVHHFVAKVVDSNFPGATFSWYHKIVPLSELGIESASFAQVYDLIEDYLQPGPEGFAVLSNPDVLPYGYGLHLSAVSMGPNQSQAEAERIHELIVNKLKSYYGHKKS